MTSVAEASARRLERMADNEIDKRIDLLLANVTFAENPADHYHAVTANARSMGYLRPLLKHYSKAAHPFRQCYAENFKRFGPKTAGLCGVLKDVLRQQSNWRGHPSLDHGSPGVAIGETDKSAAPAWGGHGLSDEGRPLSLLDELDLEFGVIDHTEGISQAAQILCALGEKCDPFRVLIGLDEPPKIDLSEVLA